MEGNAYANDCAVIFGGTNFYRLVHRLQLVIDELVDWGRTCGLGVKGKAIMGGVLSVI